MEPITQKIPQYTNATNKIQDFCSTMEVNKAEVHSDLLEKLKLQFGQKSPIGSILDSRVKTLRKVYVEGAPIRIIDPEELLGKGWKMQPKGGNDPETIFGLVNNTAIGLPAQYLKFDTAKGTTTLISTSPFKTQTIIMDRNGKIESVEFNLHK